MNQPTNPLDIQPAVSHNPGDIGDGDFDHGNGDGVATIGSTIKINGDITGRENLIINGSVEGTVDFRENDVVVGKTGRVSADLIAKNISIEGETKGELRGSEQVTVKPTGRVTGDIRAPRVVLNEGCRFKGSVDMEDKPSVAGASVVGMGDPRGIPGKLTGAKPFPERPAPPSGNLPKR